MEKKFKTKMPTDSVRLQFNNISGLDDFRKSKSEINGFSKKRKADQAVAPVSDAVGKKQRVVDSSMSLKLKEQKLKLRRNGALKGVRDQPKKKQGMMMMVSVSSGISTKRAVDFMAKSSQGSSLISTTTGGLEKINTDQESTCRTSSEDLFGVLVLPCRNKVLNIGDDQVVKKALSAARLTSRFAEIVSKSKADRANLQKERERQNLKHEEDEAHKAAQIREADQLKKKKAADSREKQREAARIALQMVEKTVELEDNLMILKELEMLSQCSHTYVHRGGYNNGPAVMGLRGFAPGSKIFNPLEQLGLYMKEDEFVTDDEEETTFFREVEEGEIVEDL